MAPPCDTYVPGHGDVNAHFHVVGDSPVVHGGLETGVPFTDCVWSEEFFDAFLQSDMIRDVDLDSGSFSFGQTFLSYLHMCDTDGELPTAEEYATMEPYVDAEIRAITAHVLLPVGLRATEHVLREYTAYDVDAGVDMDELHATEIPGSGWLVFPIKDPTEWRDGDADELVDGLVLLQQTDYRQESDLGRFLPGDEPYFVR